MSAPHKLAVGDVIIVHKLVGYGDELDNSTPFHALVIGEQNPELTNVQAFFDDAEEDDDYLIEQVSGNDDEKHDRWDFVPEDQIPDDILRRIALYRLKGE